MSIRADYHTLSMSLDGRLDGNFRRARFERAGITIPSDEASTGKSVWQRDCNGDSKRTTEPHPAIKTAWHPTFEIVCLVNGLILLCHNTMGT